MGADRTAAGCAAGPARRLLLRRPVLPGRRERHPLRRHHSSPRVGLSRRPDRDRGPGERPRAPRPPGRGHRGSAGLHGGFVSESREDGGALRAHALAYLAAHNTVSLATTGEDGIWATTVFYANADFVLYFLSEPKTQHVQNILVQPAIAATVNEDYQDWRQIKGIQMAATCREVTGKVELARALAIYLKKYPFVAQFLSPGQLLR